MLPTPLLIVDQWGDAWAFPSVEAAEAAAESLSLDEGEYGGAFTSDGRVVVLAPAAAGPGFITITETVLEQEELDRLLDAAAASRGRSWPCRNTPEVVALLLHERWEQRWPKRPAWFSRRLHGEEPSRPVGTADR
ncbi:hypothetical protein [Aquipuribacter hungaricus]|uniref:Uncharacterized protein n=1 Tax=Aquipuribacter hungaricus TaxID=545624 RepID=A0ABV7WC10_9MICO